MAEFGINPTARNPLYPEPAVLGDITRRTDLLTIDLGKGDVSMVQIRSPWRRKTVPLIVSSSDQFIARLNYPWITEAVPRIGQQDDKVLISVDDVVADCDGGWALSLLERGVHPFLETGEWDQKHFSILPAMENIVKLYFWLEKEGIPRTATKVKNRFSRYFLDWDQLLKEPQS